MLKGAVLHSPSLLILRKELKMEILKTVMAIFALLGAVDYIIGSPLGMGKQFEKGISMLSLMFLSMVGMILLAPVLAGLLQPVTAFIATKTPFDPSIVPGIFLANDMGGYPLASAVASDATLGAFNGLVVASMLGATISFTIPFAISSIEKRFHTDVIFGILCGICTIPIGCFVSGLILGMPVKALFTDLIPVIVFSGMIILALIIIPTITTTVFSWIGKLTVAVIVIGLAAGIFKFLTGYTLIPGLADLSEGIDVIVNATCLMTGAFPLIFAVSKILNRPLNAIGKKLGIDSTSILGFLSTVASFAITVGILGDMNKKGRVINVAFAVSAAFVFASHLAFTMSYRPSFVLAVVAGKLVAGVTAVGVASVLYKRCP